MNREARFTKPLFCGMNCEARCMKQLFCGMNREARCMKQLFWEIKVGKAPAVYAARLTAGRI